MMKERYLTLVGFKYYHGMELFKIGDLLQCEKDKDNAYDSDAIKVLLPYVGKVGYIANSPYTVAMGTLSAGRIYEQVKKHFYIRILFMTSSQIICRIETKDKKQLSQELAVQMLRNL